MILDPDFGLHISRPDGPQSLYRAVVARSVLDLFGKVIPASEKDEAQLARREALYFLTRERGAWAESRRRLCAACEIDPEALRTNILRILDGGEIVGADTRNSFGGIEIARQFWNEEQSEPERAQAAREQQAKPKPTAPRQKVKASYSTIRSTVLPLLSQPRQFKDLIAATDGEFGDSMICKVLANAINKGEVVRNDKNHTYILAAA
ncbi:hypothetical protein [Yoonia sp. 208BN28-4]|uniref:hypothetical protein n=1 Tax=Yoonia sp. 208BN28-4 TaxID=3126505 RepID=UPI0030A3A441